MFVGAPREIVDGVEREKYPLFCMSAYQLFTADELKRIKQSGGDVGGEDVMMTIAEKWKNIKNLPESKYYFDTAKQLKDDLDAKQKAYQEKYGPPRSGLCRIIIDHNKLDYYTRCAGQEQLKAEIQLRLLELKNAQYNIVWQRSVDTFEGDGLQVSFFVCTLARERPAHQITLQSVSANAFESAECLEKRLVFFQESHSDEKNLDEKQKPASPISPTSLSIDKMSISAVSNPSPAPSISFETAAVVPAPSLPVIPPLFMLPPNTSNGPQTMEVEMTGFMQHLTTASAFSCPALPSSSTPPPLASRGTNCVMDVKDAKEENEEMHSLSSNNITPEQYHAKNYPGFSRGDYEQFLASSSLNVAHKPVPSPARMQPTPTPSLFAPEPLKPDPKVKPDPANAINFRMEVRTRTKGRMVLVGHIATNSNKSAIANDLASHSPFSGLAGSAPSNTNIDPLIAAFLGEPEPKIVKKCAVVEPPLGRGVDLLHVHDSALQICFNAFPTQKPRIRVLVGEAPKLFCVLSDSPLRAKHPPFVLPAKSHITSIYSETEDNFVFFVTTPQHGKIDVCFL